jgi:hypothetical protein
MAVQVIVKHHVKDYDAWKPLFDEHGSVRRANGATGHALYRGVEDPNQLVIVNSFATLEGARAFMTDPGLKDVMDKAGVDSAPDITVSEEAETVSY